MFEQVLGFLGRLALCQIDRACYKLMPVGQDSARDERRILELLSNLEHQVYTLGDLIDNPVGDENLYPDLRVGRLKCADQRREQRIGDAWWRRKPQYARNVRQVVRSNVVDRFAEFGAVLSVLEHFGPNIGKPQAACRTLEQADAELLLEVGNATADGRCRHFEPARRF